MSCRWLTAPAAALSLTAGCVEPIVETSVEIRRLPAAPSIEIRLDQGDLEIREHALPEVEIEVERWSRALSREAAASALPAIVVQTDGEDAETLRIRGRNLLGGAFRLGESVGLRLTIRTAPGTAIKAWTGDGRIELSGLTGPVEAVTASGPIEAESLRAGASPAQLRTGDGRIDGKDLEGRFVAETADGRISLAGRLQQVRAVSGDGRVTVTARSAAAPAPRGVWELRSADGSVRLTLPAEAAALVSAAGEPDEDEETGNGDDWEERAAVRFAEFGEGPAARVLLRPGSGHEARLDRRSGEDGEARRGAGRRRP